MRGTSGVECHRRAAVAAAAVVLALIAAASAIPITMPIAVASDKWPPAGPSSSAEGRTIWLANCETCHGHGIAGAPIPTRASHWRERVAQPREKLYRHAIEGFFGPRDTHMPPRGGNETLSDEAVRAAVDYMAELALRTLDSSPTDKETTR